MMKRQQHMRKSLRQHGRELAKSVAAAAEAQQAAARAYQQELEQLFLQEIGKHLSAKELAELQEALKTMKKAQ